MKLEQISGDYDNVDQRALELLKTNDYELAEYMRDYIKELEVELVEEALYRNAYIYPGWKYCLPGLLKTIYL